MISKNDNTKEWRIDSLGAVTTKIGSGATPRGGAEAYKKEGISLIRSQNVLDFDFSYNGLAFIDEQQAKKLSNVSIEQNDVLINITGDSVARVCMVPSKVIPARVNQHTAIIRASKTKLDSYYLLYYLLNPYFKKYLLKLASDGATRNALTKSDIEGLSINLPPLPEQKAIAKVLTTFDNKIELLQAQNKTLETMAQTIFKEWFGKYQIGDELPEGWRVEKLGAILETYLGGTPSKSKNEFWDNGSIPWINSGEVNNFRITKGTTLITKLGIEKSSTKLLPKGTVVIAITGATLGQYSILEIESCFNQSVVGIVGNNKIKSSFIYFWIANNIHAIIRNATGGAQQHINKEDVNSFEMIVPSDELLNRYQSIVEPMMDKITNNEFEIQSLTKTRNTLLPKLMSGQVRVNNLKQTADA